MYNEKIISRLNNLTYLGPLKNANVTILSKPNKFSDMVKFFAQINTKDVIQKISFKASGCTTFMAMCSYFCEMIENKTVENALKITKETFEEIVVLPESRFHVYHIILTTFALLIKKYRKGVEKGVIIPCEVIDTQKIEEKKTIKSNSSKVNLNIGLDEVIYNESKQKKKVKKSEQEDIQEVNHIQNSVNYNIDFDNKEDSLEEDLNTINDEIVTIESQMPLEEKILIEEPAVEKLNKITKKVEKTETIIDPQIEVINNITSQEQFQIKPNNEQLKEEVVKHEMIVKQETITKEENNQEIVQTQVQKEITRTIEVKKTISENQANHLLALQSKVNKHNQEIRKEKAETNTNNLNNILARLHKSNEKSSHTEDVKDMKRDISLLQSEIAYLKLKKAESDKEREEKAEVKIKPEKEKKSLFSWFNRKK